jgi:hypothetical protein
MACVSKSRVNTSIASRFLSPECPESSCSGREDCNFQFPPIGAGGTVKRKVIYFIIKQIKE